MGFCFVRTEKIKNNAGFTRKYEHNYRTENVPNAIPQLKGQNEELVKCLDKQGMPCDYLTAYHEKIKSLEYYQSHKVTKTNIRGLEVFTTFTREERDKIDVEQWKEDNVRWLRDYFNKCPEKYGDNVISVMYHGDEAGNVHCHAIVIPIDETGKLSAEKYIGGRAIMRQMQDSYAKAMAPHGLERGLKGSSARHEDITKFYAKLNERMEIPAPEKGESAEEYRERILTLVQTERAGSLKKVMEMDRELRRKRDIQSQESFTQTKEKIDKEVIAAAEEYEKIRQALTQKNKEIQEADKQIAEADEQLAQRTEEIREMNQRAQEIHGKIGSLEQAKKDLATYRYQEAALEYARSEMPMLAAQAEQNMDTIIRAYESRERDIEH